MFQTSKEFIQAVSASMEDDEAARHDDNYGVPLNMGRAYYRDFLDPSVREADTLEEHLKVCVAIDLGVMARSTYGASGDLVELGLLFQLTPEFTARAVERWDAQ